MSTNRKKNLNLSEKIIWSVLTDCIGMLALGTLRSTWHYSMGCQQTCSCSRWMVSVVWQDWFLLFTIHKTTDNIVTFGQHRTAPSIGFIPRLRLCWRPRGLKINFRVDFTYIRKSNICSCEMDAQEANVSIPLFYRIWNYLVGWKTTNWCSSRLRSLGCGHWSVSLNQQHQEINHTRARRLGTNRYPFKQKQDKPSKSTRFWKQKRTMYPKCWSVV